MNDYYEANFKGTKPNSSTDTETTKRYIQDKYVKKKWVDEDAEDPVKVYQSGKWGKEKKKSKKKKKEESDDSESEEKPKARKKKPKKEK